MPSVNYSKRREIRRKRVRQDKDRIRSWKTRPRPDEYDRNPDSKWGVLLFYGHDYDIWERQHYRAFSKFKKRHVKARFSKKWQRKPVWRKTCH